MVAVDPGSGDIAVVSEHIDWSKACDRASVQISSDGGATFSAPSYPWGSYCEDIHTAIAYGVDGRLWLANGLRFLMRQDPEVIMVGEIRDRATAEACTPPLWAKAEFPTKAEREFGTRFINSLT